MTTVAPPLPARQGYDVAASGYDDWTWQRFWREGERPLVELLLQRFGSFGTALDIGSGTGAYLTDLSLVATTVVGVDLSYGMLSVSRASGCETVGVQADAAGLPFRDRQFDLVTAFRVFSHVRHLDAAFCEVARVLRSGGRFVMTDVDPEHEYGVTRIDLATGDEVPIETYKHSLREITSAAADAGLGHSKICRFSPAQLVWARSAYPWKVQSYRSRPVLMLAHFVNTPP